MLRKNPLVWIALGLILAGTFIGLRGRFWVAIGADVAAVALVVTAKLLTRKRR